jgi:5-methylthioadenosine/S-adenosylhomocysteine deaminase
MASILLRHADVITLNSQGDVLRDVEIAVQDEMILAVGSTPAGFVPTEIVDASRHIVLPGFFNAHTHSAMTLFRGWAEDLPLDRWFNERIRPAESRLTAEDVYWGTALAAAEMIRSGTVGFADHYFYMDQVAQIAVESGLRANLAWCTFGPEWGEIGADLPGVVRFVENWQGAGEGRVHTMLGPHSAYRCSPQFLARTAAVAARLGVGIHIHLAESQQQVEQLLARYDLTPVEVLDRNGVLDVPVLAAHCMHISAADQEILASRDVSAVQCPSSHMKMGLGVTPVDALLACGVHVALGSDGPATSNGLNMLQEARQAALIQKLSRLDARAMAGDIALRMATQEGARALGFPSSGELAPTRAADLIMIGSDTPRLHPAHDLVANVLYAAEAADVTDVMVAGRWLMRDRALLTLDEERILYEADCRAFSLVRHEAQPGRLQNP